MRPEAAIHHFVRGLLAGDQGVCDGESYALRDGRRAGVAAVRELIGAGALAGDDRHCAANGTTSSWLKRARLDADAFAAQHRIVGRNDEGAELNLAESPLARLAAGETAFLERHQVEAGERVRRLIERAQLQPRLTMTYSASRTKGGQSHKNDISDMAADARRAVADIHRVLPRDCAGVVMDVCGLMKGLQEVERDRGWPQRSAKLVLRIGLEQLAQHYGYGPFAVGAATSGPHRWMEAGARPERFE